MSSQSPVATEVGSSSVVLEIPLLVRCGFRLEEQSEGHARGGLHVTPELAGRVGHLNGTELYGLLDCTAWFAVAKTLATNEAAVTHDAHFSLLGVAKVGSEVSIVADVVKRGRTTAFVRVTAEADGKMFALATITKTIVPLDVRMRHAG